MKMYLFLCTLIAAAFMIDVSECVQAASAGKPDYGILGKPDPSDFKDFDPAILKRTPEQSLARFRMGELHPPQGTADHPMNWDVIAEHEDYQRALFYRAAEGAPQLIKEQDWKWVRNEEKDLISSSCDNAGSTGVRYELSEKDCKKAGAH